jgi:hypothetical protein
VSEAQRRGNQCGLHVEAGTESCPGYGVEDLVWVSGQALADRTARYHAMHAPHPLFDEAPIVCFAFCGGRIQAAKAFHSRHDDRPVCWTCKQQEEPSHEL